jgi:ubiquinone/menaquinone biosynthesis C-methylase UbiE
MSLAGQVRAAYDEAGQAWSSGPLRLYTELARPLVDAAGDVTGALVLDVGTGAGAVASLLRDRGARVLASDGSLGMLLPGASARPPGVVADAAALPVGSGHLDLVTAGFVLNHLPDPLPALREAARVLRPGGRLLASTFGGEAAAEAKGVLDEVAAQHGFVPPSWYAGLRATPLFRPTTGQVVELVGRAGLTGATAQVVVVEPTLTPEEVVAWRWGMAHLAGFVASLSPEARRALDADATRAVEGLGPLEFPVLVLSAQTGSPSRD